MNNYACFLMLVGAALIGCGTGEQPKSGATGLAPSDAAPRVEAEAGVSGSCAWGTEALLAKIGVSAPDRMNCGSYGSNDSALPGARCFEQLLEEGNDVEFTFNSCDDCQAPTTYVGLRTGERIAARMEEDAFGDDLREATVTLCDGISAPSSYEVSCLGAREVYRCTEPLAIERTKPASPPVMPRKLADVPATGEQTLLHLYVSNQSFERPTVDIELFINDEKVVIGDFDVEGQHNWIGFDIAVPIGALDVRAYSVGARATFSMRAVEIPGERWAVLEYWNDPSPRFTWRVSERRVAFD